MDARESRLDELLAESTPETGEQDAALRVHIRQLSFAAAAQADNRTPLWARLWSKHKIAVSVVGILAIGLTTGAVVNSFDPDGLFVDNVRTHMEEISIYYETSTGKTVNCTIGISFENQGNTNAAELTSFIKEHDWSGIGQRIYQEAIDHPFAPGPGDHFEPNPPTQSILDQFSFHRAEHLIYDEIPATLLPEGTSSGGSSNCTGELR